MNSLSGILAPMAACRVLIIDDSPTDAALATRILNGAGVADTVTVNDPRLAPQALRDHAPDLVLLDLRMPQVSGFEVLEVVRRFSSGTYLPVLVLTVDDSPESLQRALHAGAADYVTKPFNPVELALRVRNLLQNRLAYLELRRSRAWLRTRLDVFQPEIAHLDLDVAAVRSLIRDTIDADALRIAVQPIVDMREGKQVSGEALSRFPDSPLGGPAGWFAAALEVDLLDELELHALHKAVAALPCQGPGTRLAVNLSPRTLGRAADRLHEADLPWDRLTLELTEHVPIEDYAAVANLLEPLRQAGALISADDTGAGFASLWHILELSPDIIKVDIGVVRGITHDPSRQALVEMLVGFAERTGARLVAEGVEASDERDTLLGLGVEFGQGWLFGTPELVPDPCE